MLLVCSPHQERPAQLALDDADRPVGVIQPEECADVIVNDLAAQLLHHCLYDFDADPDLCMLRADVDEAVFQWVTAGPPTQAPAVEPPILPVAPPSVAAPGETPWPLPLPRRPLRYPKLAAVALLGAAGAAALVTSLHPLVHPHVSSAVESKATADVVAWSTPSVPRPVQVAASSPCCTSTALIGVAVSVSPRR